MVGVEQEQNQSEIWAGRGQTCFQYPEIWEAQPGILQCDLDL